MLFVIDESVADVLEAQGDPSEELIEALQLLASAYRRGSHLITASRSTLMILKDCPHLSRIDQSAYLKMLNDLPGTGVYSKFIRKVIVVAQSGVLDSYMSGQCLVIRISAGHVSNHHIVFETVFLSENLTDLYLYEMIAKVYQVLARIGTITLRYDPVGGGGSTTAEQYQAYQSAKNRLCLCIADSDRKYPHARRGGTCRELEDVDDPNLPLCELVCLNVQEAENLISNRMYHEALCSNPDQMRTVAELERLDASPRADSRHYLDLKEGIRLLEIIHPNADPQFAAYWSSVFAQLGHRTDRCWLNADCDSKDDCQCVVGRLGRTVLETVIEQVLRKNSIHKLAEMLDDLVAPEWVRLGELITAWLCGRSERHSA